MPKKQTNQDLFEEIVRLARGIYHWRDWRVSEFKRHQGPNASVPYNDLASPGTYLCVFVPDGIEELIRITTTAPDHDTLEFWRDRIDPNLVSAALARSMLKEIRTWYSLTASDIRQLQALLGPEVAQTYSDYLDRFRSEVGFDFLLEADDVGNLAKKVLKAGEIRKTSDWYTLKEVLDRVDQTIVDDADKARLNEIMATHEAQM